MADETFWEGVAETVARLRVPGGWLYRTWLVVDGIASPGTVRVTLVPEPDNQAELDKARASLRAAERDRDVAHTALAEAARCFVADDHESLRLILCDINAQRIVHDRIGQACAARDAAQKRVEELEEMILGWHAYCVAGDYETSRRLRGSADLLSAAAERLAEDRDRRLAASRASSAQADRDSGQEPR